MNQFLILIFTLCIPSLPLFSSSCSSALRKIEAHILVGDYKNAARDSLLALSHYPEDPLVYRVAIKGLAAAGEEGEMMRVWHDFQKEFPDLSCEQEVLEEMCWGILKKGIVSPGTKSQLLCVIAAALAQDVRALPFLQLGMRHSNSQIRALSVQLAGHYGDHSLREEIIRLFREERGRDVRIEILGVLGKLFIEELVPDLIDMISSDTTSPQEKLAAIKAIVQIREHIERGELEVLVKSKRAGLRRLACEAIAHCELREHGDLLASLLLDSHPDVRSSALQAIGLMRINEPDIMRIVKDLAQTALDPVVGVTASWVEMLAGGGESIHTWLFHEKEQVRLLAAAAVVAAGPYGLDLAKRMIDETTDPFVRANLGLALIGQRSDCDKACTILDNFLRSSKEKWMLVEEGVFHSIQKSTLSHNAAIANYPEVVNQTVRLEVINVLAMLEYPGTAESIKEFLKQRRWKVTGLAAEMLLGEGDESSIDYVRELLHDPDREIRSEAALVLATWGRDPSALPILLEIYPTADRQLQIKILEALGRIKDKTAIPFLIECLEESSLLIRMIGASILLQTMNH